LGLPFDNGGTIGIVGQPGLGPGDEFEQAFVFGPPLQFGAAFSLSDPTHGDLGIRVDQALAPLFFQQGQAMDQGKELPDIVGSLGKGPLTEEQPLGLGVHPPVFHPSRIAAGGGVHGYGVHVGLPDLEEFGGAQGLFGPAFGGALVFQIIAVVGRFGRCEAREGFVLCSLEALDLGLAVRPTFIDAGTFALPDHIEFFGGGHQLRSFSMTLGKCSYSRAWTFSARPSGLSEGATGTRAWKMMPPRSYSPST